MLKNGLSGGAALLLVCACAGVAMGVVTLDVARDYVHLSDGTVVECTVIMKGKESVTVLVGEQEKTFPMSGVVRIERGVFGGERRTFETGPVDGHEVIAPDGGEDGDIVEPVAPPAPPPKKKAAAPAAPKKPAPKKPAAKSTAAAKPAPKKKSDILSGRPARGNRGGTQGKGRSGSSPTGRPKRNSGTERPGRGKAKEKAEELIDKLEELKKRFQRENE